MGNNIFQALIGGADFLPFAQMRAQPVFGGVASFLANQNFYCLLCRAWSTSTKSLRRKFRVTRLRCIALWYFNQHLDGEQATSVDTEDGYAFLPARDTARLIGSNTV